MNNHESYLKQIQTYIARLPSLSTTAAKVLETCNNPKSSPNDLNRVISLDPVLAGQVLRLINSAYYSLRQPVSSLTRAIIMLGINTVKNLVLSCAILEQLRHKQSFRALSAEKFWAHSLGVGVIAKCLAVIKGISLVDQDEFFICGLLHDLGKIPLNQKFPNEYSEVLDMAKRSCWSLGQAEGAVFGIDHATIGGLIARKWRLSPAVIESLDCHHRPEESPPDRRQPVFMVALADIYAQLLNMRSCDAPPVSNAFVEHLLDRVGLDWSSLYDLRDTVMAEIDKAKIFLEITE
ncbi:MAG: HDOD domain-containing protein [Desulfobacterales bacterium]